MKEFLLLCHLVDSKNEVNRRRRRYWCTANKLQKEWAQREYNSSYEYMCFFNNIKTKHYGLLDTHYYTKAKYIWFNDAEKVDYHKYMDKYEAMKKLGKKRMSRIKKLCKKCNMSLKWGNSGSVSFLVDKKTGNELTMNHVADFAIDYRLLVK